MNTGSVTISLSDDGSALSVETGANVLSTAQQHNVEIIATCGGRGRCRSCRIKLISGSPTAPSIADKSQLGADEIREGYRLACQCFPQSHSKYSIAPPTHESSFQILSDPGDWSDQLTAIDQHAHHETRFGMAFDIGTTTVVGYLMNLATGETLTSVSGLNPQTVFGADIISRITFGAESPVNVKKLHQRITTFMNDLIQRACDQIHIEQTEICNVVVVGNTCMHHLFLGFDPTSLGTAPYVPLMLEAHSCSARDCGLRVRDSAHVYMLPIIAGFIGADTVSMILSANLSRKTGTIIAADIGTNCEVVLKTEQGLIACSSPAGPALEGGQIHDGMRAALGAIDKVSIHQDIKVHTIGEAPALGVCGSGLIDAAAVLLDLGIINTMGRLFVEPERPLPKAIAARLRNGEDGLPEFVLVWAGESGNGFDIVLTQADIRQLQLAKAAIMSGVVALLHQVHMDYSEIDTFLLAGGFGNYINIRNAQRVGLIPDLADDCVHYIANAAGLGAQMALLSAQCREESERIARETKHLSLAGYEGFQKIYLGAMRFPTSIEK